ncbi:nucleolar GTP-binding 2 [Olea europaea subsp. europaea]|uniref:Nuclear/nucleolar GTPase 2 n=1 Tax=Olea europaea subsp. europaea TaxID=158383 RepID=A0A8S0RD76_OLEEU|nr:nucleolar GTP-binding 2 [Olea europaea subsp. europaea]
MPSEHSLNVERKREKGDTHLRDKATIRRLMMYKGGKAVRNKQGKIIKPAVHQSWNKSGSRARIAPNQKWFGNTRTVTQSNLQKFQTELKNAVQDPTQVILKPTKLPVTLLSDKSTQPRAPVLNIQPYEETFGKNAKRKKPNIQMTDYESLVETASKRQESYNLEEDEMMESQIEKKNLEFKDERRDPLLKAGQSKRIYNELFKVIDSSDILLQVVDVRDPMGTRSSYLENYLKKEKPFKHLVIILNKCDLVPVAVTKAWVKILSKEYPTLSFRASTTNPFGKGDLIGLFRQFASLHKDKKQISIGIVGYPNVGKSSLINALKSKKVCEVAPIAGETKVWQYISLMKGIYLIDCPGVVHPQNESDTDIVLKNVVRIENIQAPESHIEELLKRVDESFVKKHYKLDEWEDATDFLEQLARRMGKLTKGGVPDTNSTSRMVLTDWLRGRLPYYVKPPQK